MATTRRQPAVSELRQELALNCCEVVLKKQNAILILQIVDAAGVASLLYDGESTGSFDSQMENLKSLLRKAVGV